MNNTHSEEQLIEFLHTLNAPKGTLKDVEYLIGSPVKVYDSKSDNGGKICSESLTTIVKTMYEKISLYELKSLNMIKLEWDCGKKRNHIYISGVMPHDVGNKTITIPDDVIVLSL